MLPMVYNFLDLLVLRIIWKLNLDVSDFSNLNISPRGADDCTAADILSMQNNFRHGDLDDDDDLILIIGISSQINSEYVEFSKSKTKKGKRKRKKQAMPLHALLPPEPPVKGPNHFWHI